jgi:hypothetical protein
VTSSISNSKSRAQWVFIAQSGMAVLVLGFIYSSALSFLPANKKGLNQWQEVDIHVQNYVFSKLPMRCVIVGSSMGNRLSPKELDPRDYNLSLGGGDALTGLEVILRSGKIPSCVLVEVNTTLLRDKDQELLTGVFHPIGFTLKKILPILQTSHQPIGVLAAAIKNKVDEEKPDTIATNFDALLEGQLADEQKLRPKVKIDRAVSDLKNLLDQLQAQGVKTFLFDMPRPEVLKNGANNQMVYQRIKSTMNPETYPWLEIDSSGTYQTEDTMHLTTSSARKFTALFAAAVNKTLDH